MRDDKYQKSWILFGTMFVSIFGMAAPTAWAQNLVPIHYPLSTGSR